MGATIGMPSIDYYEKSTYTESEFADTAAPLQSFDYDEELTTTGRGFNLKVGVITRLNDWIRVGGALHSPIFYDMEDEYSTAITAVWSDTLGTKYDSSPFGYFNYELKMIIFLTYTLVLLFISILPIIVLYYKQKCVLHRLIKRYTPKIESHKTIREKSKSRMRAFTIQPRVLK